MDDAVSRALLAQTEVIGRLMIGLAEAGHLPRQFLEQTANLASLRLEPVADDAGIALMVEQWLITARYMRE